MSFKKLKALFEIKKLIFEHILNNFLKIICLDKRTFRESWHKLTLWDIFLFQKKQEEDAKIKETLIDDNFVVNKSLGQYHS